ncbi:MAG: hypothetical protein V3T22_05605 [Planctomycetota bacterium]
MHAFLLTLSLILVAQEAPQAESIEQDRASAKNPLQLDKTGMQWVLPFARARKVAAERKRLLMIKPVAFGTSPDGAW